MNQIITIIINELANVLCLYNLSQIIVQLESECARYSFNSNFALLLKLTNREIMSSFMFLIINFKFSFKINPDSRSLFT